MILKIGKYYFKNRKILFEIRKMLFKRIIL